MAMEGFELYQRILSQDLCPNNQKLLLESKLKKPQSATIISNGTSGYVLYRLDCEDKEWLPFFNKTHNGENHPVPYPTPRYLRAFCDYIILISRQEKLYVLLVEMKSGNHSDAAKQLEASATFMDYIKATAVRISRYNDYTGFDPDNIKIRKVILKPCPKTRPKTNISKDSSINWGAETVIIPSDTLPLSKLCK